MKLSSGTFEQDAWDNKVTSGMVLYLIMSRQPEIASCDVCKAQRAGRR